MPPSQKNKFGLTNKQDLFARAYAADPNGTKAAIKAGYAKNTARVQASRLLTKENIRDAIKEYEKPLHEKLNLTAEFIIGGLMENARRCQQAEPVRDRDGEPTGVFKFDSSGANRAFELLGKHKRLFVDRTEVVNMDEVNAYARRLVHILADEVTDPALLKRILERIQNDAGDNANNV